MTRSGRPELPFPRLWTAPLDGHGHAWFRPLLAGGAVIWRSGLQVAAVDAATGALRWRCALPPDAGDGEVLARCGELTVTDGWLRPDELSTVIAIDGAGRIAWDAAVEITIGRDGVVGDGERVLATGTGPRKGVWIVPVNAATGTIGVRKVLSLGGTGLTAVPGGLLVRDTSADVERTGLYLLGADGRIRELGHGACWMAVYAGQRVATLLHSHGAGEVQVRDAATLDVTWRAPAAAPAGDADAEHVASIERERDGGPALLALRDAATGEVRWRADARTAELIDTVVLAGPVVVVASLDGWAFFRRSDGSWLGRTPDAMAPPIADGTRLFVGAPGVVLAADLAGI